MRLVSYDAGEGARAGELRDGKVFDLWGHGEPIREEDRTLSALLRGGLLGELEAAPGDGVPVESITLLAPIGDPGKIVCIGLNYRSHAEEAGLEAPDRPTFFGKFQNALAAPGETVSLPDGTSKVDYEAEIAVVVGGRCSRVSSDAALDYVAGYMLFNDLSARDWQFATPQWMPGKVFDGSAPCGPALVTPDEAGAHDAIEFKLELNGEVMQDASTSDLVHSVPELVAHLSRADDARAWRRDRHGHTARRGQRAGPARVAQVRRRDRDHVPDARRAAHDDRLMDGRVERGMRRQLASAPPDQIGWKLALNAPAIMQALGLDEPALGWLSRAKVTSGEHSLEGTTQPAVEPELLLEAGEGGAVARLGVALEVVDFDRPLDDVEEVIAADIFHRAVALGDLAEGAEPGEAVFSINGEERARIAAFEPPAETLAFVDRFVRELGEELAPGALVIAGALSPAAPVAPGDVAELDVRGAGEISLRFSA